MKAGVLVTGTEVVDGSVADENGPWLSIQLERLGVRTEHILLCRDDKTRIIDSLRYLCDTGSDLVITSGGLGPTADDVTAEAVADFCGSELLYDEELKNSIIERVRPFVKKANLDLDALERASVKQARLPRGSEIVQPAGTAPGFSIAHESSTILVLPGPPGELKKMWNDALKLPSIKAIIEKSEPRNVRILKFFGITESEISKSQDALSRQMDLEPIEITTCMRNSELEVVVRYWQESEQIAKSFLREVEEEHKESLFSSDGSTIDEQVASALHGHRLALAESCTAGQISARITDAPGASDYLAGAVVAYSNDAKVELLHVDPALIEKHGAVSAEVARSMADGAMRQFGADISLSATGIAGPDGGTSEKPVGTVFFAVAMSGGDTSSHHLDLPGNRSYIRNRATAVAMHLIKRALD